ENVPLVESLKAHFTDGPNMATFILDAYQDFARLSVEHKKKVHIRHFDIYPTYSFYKFDNVLIVAMYPTTVVKKEVPTFQLNDKSKYWSFVQDDINRMITQ